jgi:hypothetical protein
MPPQDAKSKKAAEAVPEQKARARPPFLAISFLVALGVLLLFFATFRQRRAAETDRLRLIGGLGTWVESTLEGLAQRFVEPVRPAAARAEKGGEADLIEPSDLGAVGFFAWEEGLKLPLRADGPDAYPVALHGAGGGVYLTYQRECDPESDSERHRCVPGLPRHYSVRVKLEELVDSVDIPDVFDVLLIADGEGSVLFQRGEPELRIGNLANLNWTRPGVLPGLGRGADEPGSKRQAEALSRLRAVTVGNADIGERNYRIFAQPITVDLPVLNDTTAPKPVHWIACGIVASDSLFSAAFTSSPVLLTVLVAVFPLVLLAWPFIKLSLITKRQRFSRIDMYALALSTTLGLSFLTFFAFGMRFYFSLKATVDTQLEALSQALEREFRGEIRDIYAQLDAIETDVAQGERPSDQGPAFETLYGKGRPYPVFRTVFATDGDGRQTWKKTNLPGPERKIAVAERDYYRCASRAHPERQPLPFRFAGDGDDEAGLGRRVAQAQGHALCLESVLSKISGAAEMAIARPFRDPASDQALVLTASLSSLYPPVLPRSFSFAFVDQSGVVQLHSNPGRNLGENLLKGTDESRQVSALIRERRSGFVRTSYWGQDYRLYIRPLDGVPWSLVTMRNVQDLRLRLWALAHDFLNGLLLYVTLLSVVLGLFVWWSRDLPAKLWPTSRHNPAYRLTMVATVIVLVAFAMVLTLGRVDLTFLASLLTPIAVVIVYATRLRRLERAGETPGGGESAGTTAPDPQTGAEASASAGQGEAAQEPGSRGRRRLESATTVLAAILLFVALIRSTEDGYLSGTGMVVAVISLAALFLPRRESTGGPRPRALAGVRGGVLAGLAVASFFLGNRAEVTFLLVTAAGFLFFYEIKRYRFEGRQRRLAFVSAASGLLFVGAVLPCIGLMSLATDRQNQFFLVDQQIDLARAVEGRRRDLLRREQQLLDALEAKQSADLRESGLLSRSGSDEAAPMAPFAEGFHDRRLTLYRDRLREQEQSFLQAFLSVPSGHLRAEFSWPRAAEEALLPSSVVAAVLSTRLLSAADLSSLPLGLDLVQHRFARGEWEAGHEWLTGWLPDRSGVGPRLELRTVAGEQAYGRMLYLEHAFVVICLLLVILATLWAADFLAHRILSIALSHSGEREGVGTLKYLWESLTGRREDDVNGSRNLVVVTRVPELARDLFTSLGAESLAFSEFNKPGARLKTHRQPIVVTDFHPALTEGEGEDELRRFSEYITTQRVILLTRSDPRTQLRERVESARDTDAGTEQLDVAERWQECLAGFTLRYGRDHGKDAEEYRSSVKAVIRREHGGDWNELRERLLRIIVDECVQTRRLQQIGVEVAAETHPQSYTKEEIVSRVALLARSYYQSVWDGCSVDEKLVLVRLAEDGFVNAKNFDHLVDLLEKGLLRRDPSLRLMNNSFGLFILRSVTRADVQEWEEQGGISAWNILKWLLPVPLLLIGGFLFLTQGESFSNVTALVVAVGSVGPILVNLYGTFERATTRTQIPEGSKRPQR